MERRRLSHLLAAALLLGAAAVLVFALRPAVAEAPPAPPPPAAPAPPAVAEKAPPDLNAMADEVVRDVETQRGWKFKEPVKRQLVTSQEARVWMQKEIERQVPAAKILTSQAFLRTVGLVPPDCDLKKTFLDILEGQIGGYYDTTTRTLSMVKPEGGRRMPDLIERTMLAHELTHALDDQYVDLTKLTDEHIDRSEDQDLVAGSVIEGSATSLMTAYVVQLQMSGRFDMGELQAYAQEEMARDRVFEEAPRYFSSLLATYMCGMQFLAKGSLLGAMLAPDNKAVGQNLLAAVKDMPRSTEQILHPAKYWDAAARDEPVVLKDEAAVKILSRPGRWVVHADTVGEILMAILTTPKDRKLDPMAMAMASSWTNPAATGWGGDRFFLLASGPSAKAAGKDLKNLQGVWFTFWDTPADCDEFVQAYPQSPSTGPRAVFRLGNQGAVVCFGFDEAERAAFQSQIEKSPPPTLRGGKPWSPWSL